MSLYSDNSLEDEFSKILTSDKIDTLGLKTFCDSIYEDQSKVDKTIELIEKILLSKNHDQIPRVLEILNECMPNCGKIFRGKISKTNFLRNLIQIVSPKYDGNETPFDIKNKIIDCLLLWKTEYPEKENFKKVYDKLKKYINYELIPKKYDFIDSTTNEKLNKALKSGTPEDLHLAHILINRCVEQYAKKNELIHRQKEEIKETKRLINNFNEMIGNSKNDNFYKDMTKLYDHLKNKSLIIIQYLTNGTEEIQDEFIMKEALFVNDKLNEAINKYEEIKISNSAATVSKNSSNEIEVDTECIDLMGDSEITDSSVTKHFSKPGADYLTFDDSFSSEIIKDNKISGITVQDSKVNNEFLNNKQEKPKNEFVELIDKESEKLFKEYLKTERIRNFNKDPKKVTLNDLEQKCSKDTSLETMVPNNNNNNIYKAQSDSFNLLNIELLNFFDTKKSDNTSQLTGENLDKLEPNNIDYLLRVAEDEKHETKIDPEYEDAIISDIGTDNLDSTQKRNELNSYNEQNEKLINLTTTTKTSKNLSDISLELNSVKISRNHKLFKILDDDEGLLMKIGFTDNNNFGSDIFVLLISINNQSEFAINNFHLEAGVSKPCKVRLLAPSATSLQGTEPLKLPTQDIKQILLLFNPTKGSIDVSFIISYNLNDECDAFKQPVIAKNIPYLN